MDFEQMVTGQHQFFASGKTLPVEFRLEQLQLLKAWIGTHESEIMDALHKDLCKSEFESYATEIGIVNEEIAYAMRRVRKWCKPRRVRTPLAQFPSASRIYSEPYGVALIISPWNYPFQLTVAPLVGAICAGNCAVVKPSAYSPNTSALLHAMAEELFAAEYVQVVEGGRKENEALLDQRFDYIFFTGSVAVGRTVMEKAARHLTPVSLELGGKSPCIVDETANLALAARRIVWGKVLNAGQTCVAPDYLLVQAGIKDKLLEEIRKAVRRDWGETPLVNPELPKIINAKHYERLRGLMQQGDIVIGGQCDGTAQKIAPTWIDHVDWDSKIMGEEIFGPIMPVLTFDTLEEAIERVNTRPKPLALYLFSADAQHEKEVLARVSFGGGCVNDTIVHLATSRMPFGGVGESGMGAYHGKASFDTFTHYKSVLKKSRHIDIPLRYAPYKGKLWLVKKFM